MWDLRYRPKLFSDVLGQEGAVEVLTSRLAKGTALETSYIFSGGHGQGKTSLARILARALLCHDLQEGQEPCNQCENCVGILNETSMAFTELDAASRGTIDNIRSIVDDLPFVVPGAPKRIYLFDEAHRMSKDAQDVLLKPIEDKALIAILCTTEPSKIRGTIRSRCEEHEIRKITREEILDRMQHVLKAEEVEFEDDAVMTVIDHCGGHVRDTLNKLEMIAQLGPVTADAVRERLNLSVVSTYYKILLSLGDPSKAVQMIEHACDKVGPADAATGLAEAAMNAFRLAHGWPAEYVYVDRPLAEQAYEMFGDDITRLAEYFLRHPTTSKIGLTCDVLRCSKGIPAPAAQVQAAAPIVVQAPAGPTLPPASPEAAPTEPNPEPEAEAPITQKTPEVTPEAAPEPKEEKAPHPALVPEPKAEEPKSGNGVREDGVGNLGSGDIAARTEYDVHAVPLEKARMRGRKKKAVLTGALGGPSSGPMPTQQWRREFKALLLQRRATGD